MRLRRIFNFVIMLIAFVALSITYGCGKKDKPPIGGGDTNDKVTFWDEDGNGVDDWKEQKATITFATWAYTDETMVTIDYLMAEEFMKKYPNITIEFVILGEEYDYETNMLAMMETNELPDVFLIRRMETLLPNNMLADITDMYKNDEDSEAIFDSLQTSGVFNGRRYAVPTYIYPQFWVVNKTILNEKSIPIPSYDWSFEQMESIAKAANDESKHIIGLYGRQGYYGESGTRAYTYELPKVIKSKTDKQTASKWAAKAFDGEKFNYMDDSFLEAMNKLSDGLNAGWIKTGLTADQKLEYYGAEDFVPTTGGKTAIWVEPSWSFKDEFAKFEFDWDVYPGPSGVTGGNTDIAGVSSLCKNKKAAYQFLKWMSYSEDGILKRFEIYTTSGNELFQQGNNYPFPVADYGIDENGVNKIWTSIPYGDTAPGLVTPQFLEGLRNGAYVLNKEVCGWDAADYATQDYFKEVYSGTNTYAALRQSIQTGADTEMQRMIDNIKALLGN